MVGISAACSSTIGGSLSILLLSMGCSLSLCAQVAPAPTGLTASAGDMQIPLSWSATPGATSYDIYEGMSAGGESGTALATNVTQPNYVVTGLVNESSYFFRVAAVNSSGVSALSNEVSGVPAVQPVGNNAAASFSIYPQIQVAAPQLTGFNMQPTPGVNITENSWLVNGGFSPYDSRQSFTASQDGTTTTFVATGDAGTSYYSSIATGYFTGALARTYRYSNGAWALLRADTVSSYTANSSSTAAADHTVTFAATGPQTLAGDVIWLSLDNQPVEPSIAFLDPRFTQYCRNWGAETLGCDTRTSTLPYTLSTDVPAADAGGLSLQLTDTNAETNGIGQYFQNAFVGPAAEEFQPGHTYQVDVWLKQSGVADGSATFFISILNVSHTFTGVTNTWQHFVWSFAAVQGLPAGSSLPIGHLDFNAPGTLWIDNFQLYDAAWPPNTISPQVLQAWQNYHPGTVRVWSNFGNANQGYSFFSLDSWLTPELKSRNIANIGAPYETSSQLEHLPDALANIKTTGANPWLIVNMALSDIEWGE